MTGSDHSTKRLRYGLYIPYLHYIFTHCVCVTGIFIALGLTGLGPGLHYILTNDLWPHLNFYFWLLLMAVLYIAGGVIYAMRVPERLYPGKFDIWVSKRLNLVFGMTCMFYMRTI